MRKAFWERHANGHHDNRFSQPVPVSSLLNRPHTSGVSCCMGFFLAFMMLGSVA